jgi:hypothetical protein
MRNRSSLHFAIAFLAVGLGWTAAACSTVQARERSTPLPITHLTLYDSGIGQFERQAEVQGAQDLEIHLTLAHLDDMLSTLFLATDGNVKVRSIEYPTVNNLAQARSDSALGNALSDENGGVLLPPDVEGYCKALTGSFVTVTTTDGRSIPGTVLSCSGGVPVDSPEGKPANAGPRIVLVSETGALSWVPLSQVQEVTPRSVREQKAMAEFASQLGKANGFSEVTVHVRTDAGSTGKLAAGYVRQTPLWRMAYRVTPTDKGLRLQAWAVVHNDTTEDWTDVGLTLVSGLPQSYVLSMASPRYASRELLPMDDGQNLFPQLGARTPDGLLYDWSVAEGVSVSSGAAYVYGGGSGSYGIAHGSASARSVSVGSASGGMADSSLLQVGEPAVAEMAAPRVEAEIATYTALEPVSVPRRSSSMVPVLDRPLGGSAFTLVETSGGTPTCVRADNSTGLVLQSGVATFYVNGRFRGQTLIERTEPGDVRVWCFGQDPDVSWAPREEVTTAAKALQWKNEALWVHELRTVTKDYEITNNAGQPRNLAIEIRHRANGRVLFPETTTEGDSGARLALLACPGRETCRQRVTVEEGVMRVLDPSAETLRKLAATTAIPEGQRTIVSDALPAAQEREKLLSQASDIAAKASRLRQALERKRESLKSLPQVSGSYPTLDRMLADILKAEEEVEALVEKEAAVQEQAAAQADKVAEALSAMPSP